MANTIRNKNQKNNLPQSRYFDKKEISDNLLMYKDYNQVHLYQIQKHLFITILKLFSPSILTIHQSDFQLRKSYATYYYEIFGV